MSLNPVASDVNRAGDWTLRSCAPVRARLLMSMAAIVGADGFAAASVSAVCAEAGLSRQTFYQHFQSREDCFLAVLSDAYEDCVEVVLRSFEAATDWREGVCEALASLLVLFETRPEIARVWMLESLSAGPWALQLRERKIAALTEAIIERLQPPPDAGTHPMAARAVMPAVVGTVQRHLVEHPAEPLVALLGPLMGIATDPFLPPDMVAAEVALGAEMATAILAGERRPAGLPEPTTPVEIPPFLLDPRSHRARAALLHIAEHPGTSNRQVGEAAGIASHSQVSSLLAKLMALGLVRKTAGRPGHPNQWTAGSYGLNVAGLLKPRDPGW